MTLIVFAALGLALGHWLGTARSGFVTMAAVSVGSVVLEIWLLFTSTSREWMTMLPVIIGAIVVGFMLLGALVRPRRHDSQAA